MCVYECMCVKSMFRISSYEFKCHNAHCGQHCQDFITCTCFLSHEPNVSKHSRLSRGMCSQLSIDVLRTSDSCRLLRYKAHKNIEIQKTKFMIWMWTHKYISTSFTILKRINRVLLVVTTIPPNTKTYLGANFFFKLIQISKTVKNILNS